MVTQLGGSDDGFLLHLFPIAIVNNCNNSFFLLITVTILFSLKTEKVLKVLLIAVILSIFV